MPTRDLQYDDEPEIGWEGAYREAMKALSLRASWMRVMYRTLAGALVASLLAIVAAVVVVVVVLSTAGPLKEDQGRLSSDLKKTTRELSEVKTQLKAGRKDRSAFQDRITIQVDGLGLVICDIADAVGADPTQDAPQIEAVCKPKEGS